MGKQIAWPILLLMISSAWVPLRAFAHAITPEKVTVYIFLHEDCRISQHYTLALKEMHQAYAGKHIQFIGLFPSASSKADKIDSFKEKYAIPFKLLPDYYHEKKDAFGVRVTPEVVVYNECSEEIIYRGRIDDTYVRIGQRKRVTTTSELKDVLESVVNHQNVMVENTPAVGCIIGKNKLLACAPKDY